MNPKRVLLLYVSGYLVVGGLGLAFVPDFFLDVFQSDQDYGDVMPRVAGMFMLALGGLLGSMVYREDYTYYPASIVVRTLIVVFLLYLFTIDEDPFFLLINVIVLVGLVPSYVVFARERSGAGWSSGDG
jgi:hypothetical protein